MCLAQLLASKVHNVLNLRNKINQKHCKPVDFHLLARGILHDLELVQILPKISLVIRNGCLHSKPGLTW